jgi:hypothetical protein
MDGIIPGDYISGNIEVGVASGQETAGSALAKSGRVRRGGALNAVGIRGGEAPTSRGNGVISHPGWRRVCVIAVVEVVEDCGCGLRSEAGIGAAEGNDEEWE